MGDLTLVSQGMLDDKGYEMRVKGGVVHVWDGKGKKSFEAVKADDRLYHCDQSAWGSCLLSPMLDSLQDAHLTFGHLGEQYLRQIGEFSGHVDCDTCKMVKATRQRYSKQSTTTIPSVGHTFVSDVKQMKTHSNKGNKYILTFVDRKKKT